MKARVMVYGEDLFNGGGGGVGFNEVHSDFVHDHFCFMSFKIRVCVSYARECFVDIDVKGKASFEFWCKGESVQQK